MQVHEVDGIPGPFAEPEVIGQKGRMTAYRDKFGDLLVYWSHHVFEGSELKDVSRVFRRIRHGEKHKPATDMIAIGAAEFIAQLRKEGKA